MAVGLTQLTHSPLDAPSLDFLEAALVTGPAVRFVLSPWDEMGPRELKKEQTRSVDIWGPKCLSGREKQLGAGRRFSRGVKGDQR